MALDLSLEVAGPCFADEEEIFGCCKTITDGKVVLVPCDYGSIGLFNPIDNSYEEVGSFEGDGKFKSCAATPDGKIVMVPYNYGSIVVFNPMDKSYDEIGSFPGDGKFSSCAATPNGKIVLVPQHYGSIVVFNPLDSSYEEIGSFDDSDKFRSCTAIPDGRIVLVPEDYGSIVIFNPRDKSFERVGSFEGGCQFRSCAVTPDGKVVLVPYHYGSIVIFNPTDLSFEEIGDFGTQAFESCAATPDGKVVLAPSVHDSIVIFNPIDKSFVRVGSFNCFRRFRSCVATPDGKVVLAPSWYGPIVIFNTLDNTYEEIGSFENSAFVSCDITPDGKIVMAPWDCDRIAVLGCPAWHGSAQPTPACEKAGMLCRRMWEERSFTDAIVVAASAGCQRAIHVHRAVLASRSDFFKILFESSFRDSLEAVLRLPEDADIVEAALRHIYTGELGEVDVVQLLRLAHRLGLNDCVVDCTAAMHGLEEDCLATALAVLSSLRGHPAVDLAWAKLMDRITGDKRLASCLIECLANLACRSLPSPAAAEQPLPGFATSQTNGEDSNTLPLHQQHSSNTESATVATQTENTGIPGDSQDPMAGVLLLPNQYIILHFGRCPKLFSRVLQSSSLGQNLLSQNAEVAPLWANGAQILVPGLCPEDLQRNGHDPASLRPWHVVARVEDVPEVFRVLQRLPYHERPRAKNNMARRGFLKKSVAPWIPPEAGSRDSCVNGALHGKNRWAEPLRVVPSLALNLPTLTVLDGLGDQEVTLQKKDEAGSAEVGFEDCASEPAAAIDKETADAISKAIASSFLEEQPCVQGDSAATGTMALRIRNTFLHAPEDFSCSHSPRTLVTV